MESLKVTVWSEYRHEKQNSQVQAIYPQGMHEAIADFLRKNPKISVRTATLDEPDHGLTEDVLKQTDVLTWWGHIAHHEVADDIVQRVKQRVHEGMGLILLHSAHWSKLFKALMGTPCNLKWRVVGEKERLWNLLPLHPITQGIGDYFEIAQEEMYGEPFGIPTPDELLFISWFEGGEVFRSGATWRRGLGKIFYFRPGHETFPTFYQPEIQHIITNAVFWARPDGQISIECPQAHALEPLPRNK